MTQKKYLEIDVIKNNRKTELGQPGIVSQEEVIAMIRAETGQSEATVREALRLFANYVNDHLEREDRLYIETPHEWDLLLRRVDVN